VFRKGLRELLASLVANEYDVVAAFENWEIHHHFQSFCLSVSGSVFRDKLFQRYWSQYVPVSNRRWCIHAGEVGFSRLLRKITDSYKVVYNANDLIPKIAAIPAQELWRLRDLLPIDARAAFPRVGNDHTASEVTAVAVSNIIGQGSQVHRGGFLFIRFCSCPLMKRDLIYRLLYTLTEVDRFFGSVGNLERKDEILNDLRRRGAPHFKGLAQRRYRLGLI
jgi:hypothetical protein